MGILGSAYGPLLEHLARRFEVSLSVAGGVLSAHFFGALLGVLISMRALQRLPSRAFVISALSCLAFGCGGLALAPACPAFLAGVVGRGVCWRALGLGWNWRVALC